jgi:hypothetical protein
MKEQWKTQWGNPRQPVRLAGIPGAETGTNQAARRLMYAPVNGDRIFSHPGVPAAAQIQPFHPRASSMISEFLWQI